MKLSAHHKSIGDDVELKLDYENLNEYDKVFISKVFTKTIVPDTVLEMQNISYGGTGFFYDKAPPLPEHIEHIMPDYHLYDEWVGKCITNGANEKEFTYYQDYSIGFLTRGCHRRCQFCINKNSKGSYRHSPLTEFVDPNRKKICLQDDNFFACSEWKSMLLELQKINIPFQFKQGLDERLLTDEKCEMLFNSKYDGDYIFAFDNIAESRIIEEQLIRIRRFTNKIPKFYTICGFDRNDMWDDEFWHQDIIDLFTRIELLGKYRCIPYITRYERYKDSPLKDIYINVARWCNQPAFFKKMSFMEFCWKNGESSKAYKSAKNCANRYSEFRSLFERKWFTDNAYN
jgi:hypothetical protein